MGNLQVGSLGVEDLTSHGELDFSPRPMCGLCVCVCRWGPWVPCCQGDMENLEAVPDLNFGEAS